VVQREHSFECVYADKTFDLNDLLPRYFAYGSPLLGQKIQVRRSKVKGKVLNHRMSKKLGYRRGTARRATAVETLSTAAQLYGKKPLEKNCNR